MPCPPTFQVFQQFEQFVLGLQLRHLALLSHQILSRIHLLHSLNLLYPTLMRDQNTLQRNIHSRRLNRERTSSPSRVYIIARYSVPRLSRTESPDHPWVLVASLKRYRLQRLNSDLTFNSFYIYATDIIALRQEYYACHPSSSWIDHDSILGAY